MTVDKWEHLAVLPTLSSIAFTLNLSVLEDRAVCMRRVSSLFSSPEQRSSDRNTSTTFDSGAVLKTSARRLFELLDKLENQKFDTSSSRQPRSVALTFLTCNALFPARRLNKTLPPCDHSCLPVVRLLRSMELFVNASTEPLFQMMEAAVAPCKNVKTSFPCVTATTTNDSLVPTIIEANSSSDLPKPSRNDPGGFCFTPRTCNAPLRQTSTRDHWHPKVQASFRMKHQQMARVFPNRTLDFDPGLLPCGRDCISVGFTALEHSVGQIILSTASSVAMVTVLLAVVTEVRFDSACVVSKHFFGC